MTETAVEFAGNFRVHVALNVSDLAASIRFYELLLGVPPTKQRPGYAKFEPQDPSVNLTLNETQDDVPAPVGAAHFGVQVKSVGEIKQATERFQQAGFSTATEEHTTCCYALQDKVWVTDPDGHRWEVFVVLEADAPDESGAGCCSVENVVSLSPMKRSDE